MLGLGGPLGCRPLWTEPSLNSFNSRRVSDDVHLERFLSFTLEVSHAVPRQCYAGDHLPARRLVFRNDVVGVGVATACVLPRWWAGMENALGD